MPSHSTPSSNASLVLVLLFVAMQPQYLIPSHSPSTPATASSIKRDAVSGKGQQHGEQQFNNYNFSSANFHAQPRQPGHWAAYLLRAWQTLPPPTQQELNVALANRLLDGGQLRQEEEESRRFNMALLHCGARLPP